MSIKKKSRSEALIHCATKACTNHLCDNECYYVKKDNLPFGVTIIPGSGKLFEFPTQYENLGNVEEGFGFLEAIKDLKVCPKAFPPTTVCIKECCEFANVAHINFINGNLLIGDPSPPLNQNCQNLLAAHFGKNDALDIFPNLLGVNGSIYIVDTLYRKITGFDKLRFVTGSIVIVNNPNLIQIPTFPSLLNVSSQIIPLLNGGTSMPVPATCGKAAIIIANNRSLRKIVGFEALRQVKDGIFISENKCLTNICGFIHLYRTDRIVIHRNERLSKIIGFCYTDTVNLGLYIIDNNTEGENDLVISAFLTLETAGKIVIIANNFLKSLKFDALRTVIGEFIVTSNPHLEELSSSVQFVNDLDIENNKNLISLKFPCLNEVNQQLNINGNCSLLCLNTFEELKRVGAGIMIADNKQLCELKGFNKLKYIGSRCVKRPSVIINGGGGTPNHCLTGCNCNVTLVVAWADLIRRIDDCIVEDIFKVDIFDSSVSECKYVLPVEFFKLLCNSNNKCDHSSHDEEVAEIVSFSLIVFRNSRLKAIGGFACLKHVEAVIYIIFNAILHTIHAFGQLAYALDVWIRNNSSLKYIIGFNNLLSVRDLVLLESVCLVNWDNIKSLEYAQNIALESKTAKAIRYPKHPIPSVLGYALYYSFGHKHQHRH